MWEEGTAGRLVAKRKQLDLWNQITQQPVRFSWSPFLRVNQTNETGAELNNGGPSYTSLDLAYTFPASRSTDRSSAPGGSSWDWRSTSGSAWVPLRTRQRVDQRRGRETPASSTSPLSHVGARPQVRKRFWFSRYPNTQVSPSRKSYTRAGATARSTPEGAYGTFQSWRINSNTIKDETGVI